MSALVKINQRRNISIHDDGEDDDDVDDEDDEDDVGDEDDEDVDEDVDDEGDELYMGHLLTKASLVTSSVRNISCERRLEQTMIIMKATTIYEEDGKNSGWPFQITEYI